MNEVATGLAGRASGADGRELIAFRAAEGEFCADVRSVREIRGWSLPTALPHMPPYVQGVINLRGAVLPIVDLAARLGFPPAEPTARHVIIVAELSGQLVGLLVDAVSDILTATDKEVQPTPEVAAEPARSFLRGVLAVEGRMVSLLALDRILPPLPAPDEAA